MVLMAYMISIRNIPVRLGKEGVEEIVEFDLTDDEMAALT